MNLLEFFGMVVLLIGGIWLVPMICRSIFAIGAIYFLMKEGYVVLKDSTNVLQSIAPILLVVAIIMTVILDLQAAGKMRLPRKKKEEKPTS